MEDWLGVLHDSKATHALYGRSVPDLRNVILHEVAFHADGNRVQLRFDLAELPQQRPAEWAIRGLDTVQVELHLVGIREAVITGWSHLVAVDLSLNAHDGTIVCDSSGDSHIHVVAEHALISRVSVYERIGDDR